ncbi:MAG: D-inositol-3-phosphate glycosyltransferase [Chlamydiae bacterium]|nr:D-inositol-3-phosphate glycosyltransferase [Chlamydiota bacterium]
MQKIALNYSPLYSRHNGRSSRTGIYRYSYYLVKNLLANPDYSFSLLREKEDYFDQYALYHSLFHIFPISPSIIKNKQTKALITIHDLIAWIHPELFPLHARDITQIEKAQENKWIIVPSFSTKNDLMSYFSIPSERIFVTPLAACPKLFYPNSCRKSLEKYAIPNAPYFFYLGRIEERKGIHLLLKAFSKLILEEKISDLNLILSGPITASYPDLHQVYQKEIRLFNLEKRVFHIPYICDSDLSSFFSNALAFVFLSRYEGFGLPALESMQCGTPPICLHNSSLPEVVGDGGLLLKDSKLDSIAESLLQIYRKTSLHKSLSEKSIQQASLFTWQKTAQKTIEAYQSLLD